MPESEIIQRCEDLYYDVTFSSVRAWKAAHPGRLAIGHMPVYVPREIIHAAGMLPVGIVGGGDQLEIIRGDAFFQSYICHIPRSVIELGISGRMDCIDGMLFPSICDVVRNLSGMWKLQFPEKYVRYLDLPQNFDPEIGGRFYRLELEGLRRDLEALGGEKITDDRLRESIETYNEHRRWMNELYDRRAKSPWKLPASEVYLLTRAANLLPVEAHTAMIQDYLAWVETQERPIKDKSRIIVVGAFCEQPPLGLVQTLERSGCYLVDDDFILGTRWIVGDISTSGDPIEALVMAFLHQSREAAVRYSESEEKGKALLQRIEETGAEGVIFCAPSFCDPALLDQPMLQGALDRAGIPYTSFKYAENTGQFQVIREQTGTFSDSIKLWGEESDDIAAQP